jgi:hypothetical protein
MKPLAIDLPTGAQLSTYLYPEMDFDDLDQDLITVRLPNGYFIDVGWYPEHDPNGRFVVRVFFEFWDGQQPMRPFETKDPIQARMAVEKLAEHFSKPQIMLSRSGRSDPIPVHV